MRICLEFQLAKPELEKDYRRCFLSVIKSALSCYNDGVLMNRYYDGTKQKDFTWGVTLNQPIFQKYKILLGSSKVKMVFSTDDTKQTGYFLFSAFLKLKNVDLPLPSGNVMVLKDIRQLSQKVIDQKCYLFKIVPGSPLLLRKHEQVTNHDNYYSIVEEQFEIELLENMKRQAMAAGFPEEYNANLRVNPICCKKVVVYHYGVYLDATAGMLEIEGEPILLQYFYQNGIGSRRSAGFGMIDVVTRKDI